jgi:hypothetical protein
VKGRRERHTAAGGLPDRRGRTGSVVCDVDRVRRRGKHVRRRSRRPHVRNEAGRGAAATDPALRKGQRPARGHHGRRVEPGCYPQGRRRRSSSRSRRADHGPDLARRQALRLPPHARLDARSRDRRPPDDRRRSPGVGRVPKQQADLRPRRKDVLLCFNARQLRPRRRTHAQGPAGLRQAQPKRSPMRGHRAHRCQLQAPQPIHQGAGRHSDLRRVRAVRQERRAGHPDKGADSVQRRLLPRQP